MQFRQMADNSKQHIRDEPLLAARNLYKNATFLISINADNEVCMPDIQKRRKQNEKLVSGGGNSSEQHSCRFKRVCLTARPTNGLFRLVFDPMMEGPWCRFRREARASERHRHCSGG
jgi:hypothetical protein